MTDWKKAFEKANENAFSQTWIDLSKLENLQSAKSLAIRLVLEKGFNPKEAVVTAKEFLDELEENFGKE